MIPNISPLQNTPVLPNIRRMVTRPIGASCSRRNSAKLSLATIMRTPYWPGAFALRWLARTYWSRRVIASTVTPRCPTVPGSHAGNEDHEAVSHRHNASQRPCPHGVRPDGCSERFRGRGAVGHDDHRDARIPRAGVVRSWRDRRIRHGVYGYLWPARRPREGHAGGSGGPMPRDRP